MNGDRPVVVTFPDGQERLVESPLGAVHAFACPTGRPVGPSMPATLFLGANAETAAPLAWFLNTETAEGVAGLMDAAHILYVMGGLNEAQREILHKHLARVGYPV